MEMTFSSNGLLVQRLKRAKHRNLQEDYNQLLKEVQARGILCECGTYDLIEGPLEEFCPIHGG